MSLIGTKAVGTRFPGVPDPHPRTPFPNRPAAWSARLPGSGFASARTQAGTHLAGASDAPGALAAARASGSSCAAFAARACDYQPEQRECSGDTVLHAVFSGVQFGVADRGAAGRTSRTITNPMPISRTTAAIVATSAVAFLVEDSFEPSPLFVVFVIIIDFEPRFPPVLSATAPERALADAAAVNGPPVAERQAARERAVEQTVVARAGE